MQRVLCVIPGLGVTVYSFSAALLVACLGAIFLTAWRARREGMDPEDVYGLAPWLLGGGIVGARLLYVAMHPGEMRSPLDVLRVWQGGIIFYGCIAGGLAGSILYWSRRRFPFLMMCDAVAPALAFGIMAGRVGCHLNGCCFGAPSGHPWAVQFPAMTLPWVRHVEAGWIAVGAEHSLPVHPKQLYAAFAGLALLGLLTAFYPRRRRDGEVMALLMIAYPITRFAVEFFRGDAGGLYLGLAVSQYISLALAAGGLLVWRMLPAGRVVPNAASSAPASRRPLGGSPGPIGTHAGITSP